MVAHLPRAVEKPFGDPPGALRVAGQQAGLGVVAGRCTKVDGHARDDTPAGNETVPTM